MDILSEIFTRKRIEVAERKGAQPLTVMRRQAEASPRTADFIESVCQADTCPALIAEVKFHSPSRGKLVKNPDPVGLARLYAQNNAAAISVLTDEEYFHGKLDYLRQIHAALPDMPLLRKDFIFDPYQVYETRAAGASAILLIAAYLEAAALMDLHALALSLNLTPLVEVHNYRELDTALSVPDVRLVGVNNRDLHTFKVDLQTCLNLRPAVPEGICVVAESGIRRRDDIQLLAEGGVDAVLIGEALVTAKDLTAKIKELFGLKERLPGEA